MQTLQIAALIAATMTTGTMAGIFALYSHTVMPGLGRTDDRTFVGAFQAMDNAILNVWFMAFGFLGALVFTGTAAGLLVGGEGHGALPWVLSALALYLAVVVITATVNVPLNNTIKAAGDPDAIADLAGVRARFGEGRWTRWNHVRTVLCTAAFGLLTWSLVEFGRTM
jgi:uncharacterized membrane protein